jgi:NodT family efflux transporter outer membrane factor (OMF) lipoprotein
MPNDISRRGAPDRLPMLLIAFLLVAGQCTMSACGVGPRFKKPEAKLNETWSAHGDPRLAPQAAADSLWWKTFNDPTLDRLIDVAYQQNLTLQIAGLRIVEARAQLGIATGKQYPQVQEIFAQVGGIGLTKQQANALNINRQFAAYQLGFDAAWELDFWGKYRRGVEAEAANLLSTVADYYAALVSLTAETARTYATIRTFEVLIQQAQQNAQLQEEALHIAESRFRNGATSELDVAQATTLLESTRASIPQLQIGAYQSRNALSTLLGQPTGGLDALLDGPKDIPKAPPTVAISLPAEMLRRRPDIRSAEFVAAAQCARIGIAKADLYPSFSIAGQIGLRAVSSGVGSHNLFTGDSFFWSVGPQLNWPLLNYGRIKNSVRVQDARYQQLLVGYRTAVLKAAQEVEDALTGFLNSQEAMMYEQRSVDASKRSEALAKVQYQEGAVDYQRVLDAQRFLLQEENKLAQTRSSVAINLIALYKALGGGWEVREGRQVVPEGTQEEMKERTNWGRMLSQPPKQEAKANQPSKKP